MGFEHTPVRLGNATCGGKHSIHQILSLVSTTFVCSSREQKWLTVGDSVFPPSRMRAGWPRIPLGGKPLCTPSRPCIGACLPPASRLWPVVLKQPGLSVCKARKQKRKALSWKKGARAFPSTGRLTVIYPKGQRKGPAKELGTVVWIKKNPSWQASFTAGRTPSVCTSPRAPPGHIALGDEVWPHVMLPFLVW